MRKILLACAVFAFSCPHAWSGAVMEMEVKEPGSKGKAPLEKVFAEGKKLRMDTGGTSMLFRDEALWMMNHEEKKCQKIDKQDVEQLSAQLGGMSKQMEAEMAKLTPEQRAMMEKMMKGGMPGGMGRPSPPRHVEKGATEQVGEFRCTVHTLYSGDEKVWEVCAATGDLPAAATEALTSFRAISEFAKQLREAVQQGPFAKMIETPFTDMDEVQGFPVRVRMFQGGNVVSETTLKSIVEKELGDDVFSVPDDYKVTALADQMKRGQ